MAEKTGQPLAAPELLKEDVFLPSFFVQHIKFHEGAFRGMQEDVNKSNNRSSELFNRVNVIGETFLAMQDIIEMNTKFMLAMRESGMFEQIELTKENPLKLVTDDT